MKNTKLYSIALDDEPIVHKIIAQMMDVPALPFSCPHKLLSRAKSYRPIAVFCDINLDHELSGLDYITEMRSAWPYVPIIVMTSSEDTGLVKKALELGANDFIRKPLNRDELVGRVQSRINEMTERHKADLTEFGDVSLNLALKEVSCRNVNANLSGLEASLLSALISSSGLPVSRDQLRREMWGKLRVSDNSLDKKISNLRQSLREVGSTVVIQSIYGKGVQLSYERKLDKTA